jgi:hypothetical protein
VHDDIRAQVTRETVEVVVIEHLLDILAVVGLDLISGHSRELALVHGWDGAATARSGRVPVRPRRAEQAERSRQVMGNPVGRASSVLWGTCWIWPQLK